jgi:diguanylate cyclase (GGDEF)-like protein
MMRANLTALNHGITEPTVLLIDDDAMIRLLAAEALEDAGFKVVVAANAERGLALFETACADLVLLDIMMPGMSGYEACAHIRAHRLGQHIPIIVMTGLDDRKSILEAYEAGATDFITKPILWDLLPFRVRYALRSSRALQDSMRSQALLSKSQRIANMGSWEWNCETDTLTGSDELLHIHGVAPWAPLSELRTLLKCVHDQDRPMLEPLLAAAVLDGQAYSAEFRIVRPSGEIRHVSEQTSVEFGPDGGVLAIQGIQHDTTQKTETANHIHLLAYSDPLTGLANRALFREMMAHWLAYSTRRDLHLALILVNLDQFKVINDTLGSAIGDEVLKITSDRLRTCVRAEDPKTAAGLSKESTLARLGADEYTVVLVDIKNAENAIRVANRILDQLSQPFVVNGHELSVGASIGIAISPDDGNDVNALLQNASTAMHAAKSIGPRQVRLYSNAMSEAIRQRHTLDSELRRALREGELRIHYQAKVDARCGTVVGAEALLRWEHPVRGIVGPGAFIPAAEQSGLIVPMTDWVVECVCAQIAAWSINGIAPVPVSVNLDGKTLRSNGLVDRVRKTVERTGIAISMLEFEMTESILMDDLEASAAVLGDLKALGCRLAIDDFGTGYSSLTYLKRFPVDILKIDRGFIKDLPSDASDAALTTAIVAIGKSLGLDLIAEGVETWEQVDFLNALGCNQVQGFLFSRPIAAEFFEQLLRTRVTHPAPRLRQPAIEH